MANTNLKLSKAKRERIAAAMQIAGWQCPLWVKSRHRGPSAQCPLYPQKRTLELSLEMSALCQKETSTAHSITSSAMASTLGGIAETKSLCSRNVDDEFELHWAVLSYASGARLAGVARE